MVYSIVVFSMLCASHQVTLNCSTNTSVHVNLHCHTLCSHSLYTISNAWWKTFEMIIFALVINWFPWQPPPTDSLKQFSLKSLLHFSNLPTMLHMEMRLCTHVYRCFHDNRQQKMPSGTFPHNYFFTSQTRKPCNAWK